MRDAALSSLRALRTWSTAWACSAAAAALAALAALASSPPVAAQTCGTEYTIADGDTLGEIAARVYGDATRWTVIFYANQDRLGSNTTLLVRGQALRLPCIGRPADAAAGAAGGGDNAAGGTATNGAADGETGNRQAQDTGRPALSISSMLRRIEFLTADGYPPYTGRELEGGGMITELISAALDVVKAESKGKLEYGISWVNDWSAHLNPLLSTRAFDLGFPWIRPDCVNLSELDQESQFRCRSFFFSDPLYEIMSRLHVRSDSPLASLERDALKGRSLCVPTGYTVRVLDAAGRSLLKDGIITLIRPADMEECFRLLDNGTVDGVVATEMGGLAAATAVGVRERLRTIDEPLGLDTLHVVVAKTHPFARTMLYYVNAGLKRVREEGAYEQIVERHLQRFWDALQANPEAKQPADASASSAGATSVAAGGSTVGQPEADDARTASGGTPAKPDDAADATDTAVGSAN